MYGSQFDQNQPQVAMQYRTHNTATGYPEVTQMPVNQDFEATLPRFIHGEEQKLVSYNDNVIHS